MKLRLAGFLILTVGSGLANPALAWDGIVVGKIYQLDSAPTDTSIQFRVRLQGEPALCGSSSASWAYIGASMPNYQATVALLITAHSIGRSVQLYSNVVSGYCQIGYVTMGG
jgi:hypothetical protein